MPGLVDRKARAGEGSVPDFSAHPGTPLPHHSLGEVTVPEMILPPVDREAARQPINPGMPPLLHVLLPAPEAFQIVVPQVMVAPTRPSPPRPIIERGDVTFPVAEAPGFHRLSPASPSAVEAPATVPRSDAQPSVAAAAPVEPSAPADRATLAAPIQTTATPAFQAAPSRARPGRPSLAERVDPLYAYLLYMALGVGTLYLGVLERADRYTVLWVVLIVMGALMTLVDSSDTSRAITSASLGWGISFGLVFSLPLLILVWTGLTAMVSVLFPEVSKALLFQLLVFVAPLGETLFFRGALQERRGIPASIVAAGLSAVIVYWPAASSAPVYLVAATIFTTVLAGVYSFVRTRYGLTAAYVCQATVNLTLLFVPNLLLS